jgi:hypothetical protein
MASNRALGKVFHWPEASLNVSCSNSLLELPDLSRTSKRDKADRPVIVALMPSQAVGELEEECRQRIASASFPDAG